LVFATVVAALPAAAQQTVKKHLIVGNAGSKSDFLRAAEDTRETIDGGGRPATRYRIEQLRFFEQSDRSHYISLSDSTYSSRQNPGANAWNSCKGQSADSEVSLHR